MPPAFIRADTEGLDHYGCAEQQENQVPREIPYGVSRSGALGAEASAVDIDSARNGAGEGPPKNDQEQIGKGRGARQPPTAQDECAQDCFEAGEHYGDDIDKRVGKDLIILNYFGKFSRVRYFGDACGHEYEPEEQSHD